MRELMTEAVDFTVNLERKSQQLYEQGARAATDQESRRFFEQLAQEQSRRIDALLQGAPELRDTDRARPWIREGETKGSREGQSLSQLHQAVLDKRFSIDLYATFCRCFKEPAVTRFFESALTAARREFKLIIAEYLKAGGKAKTTTLSGQPRRSHQRGELPQRAPNPHSPLFFAMQDCGRHSRIG